MLLTPKGEISQYFTGIEFSAPDVRLALVEASQGSIGSALDHIMLFCFRFDQTKGRYTWAAFGIMRLGGFITLLLLGGLLVRMWLRERAKARS
jgi:protein SCO1/2